MGTVLKLIKGVLTVAILLSLGFCLWVNLANSPGRGEIEAHNRQAAETVLAALASYRTAEGRYPEQLAQLVPGQLAALPALQPTAGQLGYRADATGTDFTLSYPVAPLGTLPSDAEHRYTASEGSWQQVVY